MAVLRFGMGCCTRSRAGGVASGGVVWGRCTVVGLRRVVEWWRSAGRVERGDGYGEQLVRGWPEARPSEPSDRERDRDLSTWRLMA